MGKHIVITVFGSLGDLHPMMAIAMGLMKRGHRVTIATTEVYREKVTAEGLAFHPVRPEMDMEDKQIFEDIFDPVKGPELLINKYVMPSMKDTYTDLRPLLETADFLVNSPLIFPGPLIAESIQLPWASLLLQPFGYFSIYDPPLIPAIPISEHWHQFSPLAWKLLMKWIRSMTNEMIKPVTALRGELGLPDRGNPMFEGQFSPHLNLAIFSSLLAQPQQDWPPNTQITGFSFYDQMKVGESTSLPPEIQAFLDAGPPPVVFTLGSSAVRAAGSFYENSIEAVEKMGCRGIFLTAGQQPSRTLNDRMLVWDAVSYANLFPHVAAVVHQGGAGTTGQALRAGKPMLMVPYGFDQPDNAIRLKRRGLAAILKRKEYTAGNVVKVLTPLLKDAAYAKRAMMASQVIQAENGTETACNIICKALDS